jgi:uncharacterized protein YmfQ (DUF2313 family)
MSDYLSVLQQLLPRGIAWNRRAISSMTEFLKIFGNALSTIGTEINKILLDTHPSKSTYMQAEWESELGLSPYSGDTIATRNERIAAAYAATGGQSIYYFYSIAEKLGYNRYPSTTDPHIRIQDQQFFPFRVGISKVGVDKLYSQTSGYSRHTWTVSGTSVTTDTTLRELFEKYKPAHTEIVWSDA